MYKFVSGILLVALLVLGGAYLWQRHAANELNRQLSNKIAELEGTIKETETAASVAAVELENLKSHNKELQDIIEKRDEEIAAIGYISLQWKEKYFKIKNAQGSVEEPVPEGCDTCAKTLRLRVDFDQTQDYLRVSGHTITNPAYAEVDVRWERELKLSFILAKKDDKLRLYVDSESPDIVPGELTLKVDPSVFERKWYEKFYVGGFVNVGRGVAANVGLGYEVTEKVSVGPSMLLFYDPGRGMFKLYGATVQWYPFR